MKEKRLSMIDCMMNSFASYLAGDENLYRSVHWVVLRHSCIVGVLYTHSCTKIGGNIGTQRRPHHGLELGGCRSWF